MTEPIKLQPGDEGYAAVYTFWLQNDKPAYCRMANATWMKLSTDGLVVFILTGMNDEANYQSLSTRAISK